MFESALADTPSRDRGTAASMGLAVGAHLAAALAVVGASLLALGPTPQGPDEIVPVMILDPPPLGGSESYSKPRQVPARKSDKPGEVVQPQEVTETVPRLPLEPGPASPGPEGSPGSPEGDVGGPGGGPGAVPGTGPRTGDRFDTGALVPLEVGGDVVAPVLQVKIEPRYPESARRAGLEGRVVVRAVIAPDGSVEDASIVASTNPLFDAAARDAVARWRFRAATRGGVPVRVWLTVTVTFKVR